ncbi:hypothetical protein Tco_1158353 [Tanacetum coccineum]
MTQRLTLKLEAWLCRHTTLHAIYNLDKDTENDEVVDKNVIEPTKLNIEETIELVDREEATNNESNMSVNEEPNS